jgi:formylglycine-generating enzyme required for sulfatase activity
MLLCVIMALPGALAGVPLPGQEKKAAKVLKHMEVDVGAGVKMKFVYIEPGKFTMGSPKEEKERWDNELQHDVEITKGFWMGVYTVTQEEYEKVMGKNPSSFRAGGDDSQKVTRLDTRRFPVENVSWHDAKEACRKFQDGASHKHAEKKTYRLPTEAEWEYACRAGTSGPYHYGNSLSSKQANFDGNFPYGGADKGLFLVRPTKVGSYEPNVFGLYDVHGNVFQWCEDWYAPEYYKASPARDPQGPGKGNGRVIRGGSWASLAKFCRSAFRCGLDHPDRYTGFRVVVVP